jgi:dipeptidyl aminopeptidase/acylaminoacyl peptidase
VALNKELLDPFGDIAWSPDGQTLAFSLYTGSWKTGAKWPLTDVALVDANGQNVRRLAPGFDPVWSPSGNLIAYLEYNDDLSEGYIRIVDVTTGQVTSVTTIKRGGVYPILAWASGAELLYYQDTVVLFDYTTGQKSDLLAGLTLPSTESPLQILITLPEHSLIAAASGHVLIILERDKNGIHVLRQLEGVDNSALAFSPDGNALAYVSGLNQQVKIVSTRGDDSVVALPLASRGTAWSMAWSPDGASLVYADSDGVHLVNRDGAGLQGLEGLPPHGTPRLAWSRRGSLTLSINTSDVFFTLFSLPTSTGR